MFPKGPSKQGILKRISFKRRERKKNCNILVFYFDGVIGDVKGLN